MAPRSAVTRLRKRHASDDSSEQIPAWLKAMERRLEAKLESLNSLLENRLLARLDHLNEARAETVVTLESRISSLQEEIQQKNRRARAPLLRYHENIKQFDVLNEFEDCFTDLERHLRMHKTLDAAAKAIIDRGISVVSNRKNLICIRDREGPRVAEFYELEDSTLFDLKKSPKIGLEGSVVTLS